jgi:hypothetical protein
MIRKITLSLALAFSAFQGFSQTLDYSFVVMGCNRVAATDTAGNPSTANLFYLQKFFSDVSKMSPLPKYAFLAGDIVLGYTPDTLLLAKMLTSWKQLYLASPLASTSVQLVVIPGNHETQGANKITYQAAERTFLRIMAPYVIGNNGPKATGLVPGTDSLVTDQSQLNYSFDYHGDHYVMVNTDPFGRDWRVPYHWISQDVATARTAGARHIFTIGHKPAHPTHYKPTDGLVTYPQQRDAYWAALEENHCEAMFSAHNHVWDTVQPHPGKTWQVIAGNGGSGVDWPSNFVDPYYGYTVVNIYTDGTVAAKSMGRTIGKYYTDPSPDSVATLRNSVDLTWRTPIVTDLTESAFLTSGINVYPNPSPGLVTVSSSKSGTVLQNITVFSLSGEKVYSSGAINGSKQEISIPTQGTYVIKIGTNAADYLHKLIIK